MVPGEDWYRFKVELKQNGRITEPEVWVSGEDTVADAQNVANRRASVFQGTVNRVKFDREGYCDD